MATATQMTINVLTPEALLEHWQGHRRVTRRVIEAFPEEKLFGFSIGSMRPFSEMTFEFLKMAEPVVRGVASGKWTAWSTQDAPKTKVDLGASGDEATTGINTIWPTIPPRRFAEVDKAFGQWEDSGIGIILYAIENEIHHRGQAYVYLRALSIEPPAFFDRK